MLIDSHCHLHLINYQQLGDSLESVLLRAKEAGVSEMLCVSTTLVDRAEILKIAENTPVYASIGLHPNEVVDKEPSVEELLALADHPKIIAIGETGLDYYSAEENNHYQKERFIHHIAAAKASAKPLIIHTRQARQDTLAVLKAEKASDVGGVMHCFTEDWETAKKAMEMNFYISLSGIVTFKNAVELQDIAKKMPLDRLLIETDSPYLAPIPHRGKVNQPCYVRLVAEYIAALRGISLEDVARQTTNNFRRLFLKSPESLY
jgi:TatD DNase family protein